MSDFVSVANKELASCSVFRVSLPPYRQTEIRWQTEISGGMVSVEMIELASLPPSSGKHGKLADWVELASLPPPKRGAKRQTGKQDL